MSDPRMTCCITTSNLYVPGGGAKAVSWVARALSKMGPVTVFTKTAIPRAVWEELPDCVQYRQYYPGCSRAFDLHISIDHGERERPLAGKNIALVFYPTSRSKPDGYDLLWALSRFGKQEIGEQWGAEYEARSCVLYLPVDQDLFVGRKEKRILHVSRFAPPNHLADKGHRSMIRVFSGLNLPGWELVMAGAIDGDHGGYLSSLMAEATGSAISFIPNPSRQRLVDLYSTSAIYWHATGISMPGLPSAQEHYGLTTIEAMVAGCVPIVFGTGGQPEIVEDGLSGLTIQSESELAAATLNVTHNMNIWGILHTQARARGLSVGSPARFYEQFRECIRGKDMVLPETRWTSPYLPHDVTMIIPVYNSKTIHRCLDRIGPGPTVIVVDNGSDEAVSHPRIDRLIRLESNTGFAAAVMKGFESSTSPLVMTMNDDCFVEDADDVWLLPLLVAMSSEDVGVVGTKLLFPNGSLQHAGVLLEWDREDIAYHRWYGGEDRPAASQPTDVPAVTGACLLARRELFDLRQDLYHGGNYEDIHLCLEAWRSGYRVRYVPGVSIVHLEGQTKARVNIRDAVLENRRRFIAEWRDWFLDSEQAHNLRELNRELIHGAIQPE